MQDIYRFSKSNQEIIISIITTSITSLGNIECSNYYGVNSTYTYSFDGKQAVITIDHRNHEIKITLSKRTDVLVFIIIQGVKIINYYISDRYFPIDSESRNGIKSKLDMVLESSHSDSWNTQLLLQRCIICLNEISNIIM
jgi:hypothetical protein